MFDAGGIRIGYMLGSASMLVNVQPVTKHKYQYPSLAGVNWVSDGASIDFVEYMHVKSVQF